MEKQAWNIQRLWSNDKSSSCWQPLQGLNGIQGIVWKYHEVFIVMGLMLLTFCAFNTILENDFIGFDDPLYITENSFVQQGLTASSIRWAFSTFQTANWHPLTWLSHMLDVEFYGLKPGGHHLTSLLIHLCNVAFLFGWLRYTTGAVWRSTLAAALFAIHPLRVESVAWAAERKDVLSCLLGLLTLWAYVFYIHKPNFLRYASVFVFLMLGLMSKAMLVTWPLLLLLADIWPLKRWKGLSSVQLSQSGQSQAVSWTTLLKEKIPLAALAGIFCVVAFVSQSDKNAVVPLQHISVPLRVANMFISYIQYLGKIVYPADLALYYPYHSIWMISALFCLMIFGVISGIAVRQFCRRPYMLTGWFWFVIGLLPVIGLVQIGGQSFADRYTYIPSIGPSVAIAWFIGEISQRGLVWRRSAITLCILCLALLLCLTWRQTYYWKDSLTLFNRTLEVTDNSWMIEQNYAVALEQEGQLDLALQHALRAFQIAGDQPKTCLLLGSIYLRQDRPEEAERFLQKALRLNADSPGEACYYLGLAYSRQNKYDKAQEYLKRAMESHFNSIAVLYALADVYRNEGQFNQAFETWRKILTLDSTQTKAMVYLAWNMATCADPNQSNPSAAVEYAVQAAERTGYDSASVLDVLAAAYARQGNFEKAVQTAGLALQKAKSKSFEELIADIKKRKQCYEDKKPWVQEPQ
jgi:tetratricopeptide (TPR) repeat protein